MHPHLLLPSILALFLTAGIAQVGDDWEDEGAMDRDTMMDTMMMEDTVPAPDDTMPSDTMLDQDENGALFGDDSENGAHENGAAPDVGAMSAMTAPSPQHLIADASLFLANARQTVEVMKKEATLDADAPAIIANQATYLESSLSRIESGLTALHDDALETRKDAAQTIEQTLQSLDMAQQQVNEIISGAEADTLDPMLIEMTTSVMRHLDEAVTSMNKVARAYNAEEFTIREQPAAS
jgi:exonuclease VII small subunit